MQTVSVSKTIKKVYNPYIKFQQIALKILYFFSKM